MDVKRSLYDEEKNINNDNGSKTGGKPLPGQACNIQVEYGLFQNHGFDFGFSFRLSPLV